MDGHEEMKNTEDFIKRLFNEVFYSRFELETKYFELISGFKDKNKAITLAGQNLLKMNLEDQIKALELLDKLGDLSVSLCEKYGFCDENDNIDD